MIKDRLILSSPDNGVKREKKAAFTLIEMLVVMAIMSIVSLTVYATLNSGVKIWQRVNQAVPAEDVDIFFEKFTSDLRNGLKYTSIPFSGEEDEFELATMVNSRRLEKTTVGKVRYRFDQAKGEIVRRRIDYSAIYDSEDGAGEVLLQGVRLSKFTYYIYSEEKQKYLWQDEWIKQVPPSAIRIELEIKNNDQTNKFIKTVSIPAS